MPEPVVLLLPLIAFLAYVIKATTGFGTAIIFVALGSLLIGTHDAIILCAVIDIIGGTILYFRDPVSDHRSLWIPLALAMVCGSIVGALLLNWFPADRLDFLVAGIISILGVWFMFGRGAAGAKAFSETLPVRTTGGDLTVSAFAGICGGLFAVSGPPIVYWLGRKYAKHAFRRTLIVVFFFATIARLLTYGATGMLTGRMLILSLAAVPGVLLGILLGNRLFIALSERWFGRVIGAVLVLVALRMMIR